MSEVAGLVADKLGQVMEIAGRAWRVAILIVKEYPAVLAGVIAVVALLVNRSNMTLQLSNTLMKLEQEYNLAVIRDPVLLEQIRSLETPSKTTDWVRGLYITFYQINIVHEALEANRRLFLPNDHTLMRVDEMILINATRSPEQLSFIINSKRGYSPRFIKSVVKYLRGLERTGKLPSGWSAQWLAESAPIDRHRR